MTDETIEVEGVRLEPKKGWVMMYIGSPLIPNAFIDVDGWAYTVEEDDKWNRKGDRVIVEPLTLAQRTNFYCNQTGVDRIMWDGYTRVGTYIL